LTLDHSHNPAASQASPALASSGSAANTGNVLELARAARAAGRELARQPAAQRTRALRAIATAVRDGARAVLAANASDLERGRAAGLTAALLDRLALDDARLGTMATAIDEIAAQPDPIGHVAERQVRPNGLVVEKVRIPLGVVAMIYEARPNVTTDAAALCLRTGNACVLRGGKEARASNAALGAAIAEGLAAVGLPARAVQIFPWPEHEALAELLRCEDDLDVVIPRGGEGLIRFVAERSRIPVIKHYKGVCHVYVHAAADPAMALAICENAKAQRPGVCNACETILIDRAIAPAFVPRLAARFAEIGVEVRGDEATRALGGARVRAASEDDWYAEYLDRIVAVRVVDGAAQAIAHLQRYGSSHTEAIVTADRAAAEDFLGAVDSSTVLWNASTRFADGGELGLGAEIGISTSKLHAYGPMGAEGLTTTKFVVRGGGQIRT
jgi:glutamate-5-semialdehyde dehydrogenase